MVANRWTSQWRGETTRWWARTAREEHPHEDPRLETPTTGEDRLLKGQHVAIPNAHRAIELGIGMVHQNFMLVPSFTIAENVVLGAAAKGASWTGRAQCGSQNRLLRNMASR